MFDLSVLRSVVAVVFMMTAASVAQDRGGMSPATALPVLTDAFGRAHTSGSIEYWGHCDFHQPYPDFPKLQPLREFSGSPLDRFRRIFAPDKLMYVIQDGAEAKIRLVEGDVPSDLLNVKISFISFNLKGREPNFFTGPDIALRIILAAPEVRAFRIEHNIGPFEEGFAWPGNSGSNKKAVSGELHDITLAEALDYVLQTFPGFWTYENCYGEDGGRQAFFYFFEVPDHKAAKQR
jgi:hypothetical protein